MIVTQCAEGVVMTNGMWCRDCPMFVPLSLKKNNKYSCSNSFEILKQLVKITIPRISSCIDLLNFFLSTHTQTK